MLMSGGNTRVILVRHGETEANMLQMWHGAQDALQTECGRVEVEVFLLHDSFASLPALRLAEGVLAERIKDHPAIRSISLNFHIAPN